MKNLINLLKPRRLASTLGAALLLSLTVGATAQEATFYDLSESHWAYDAVSRLTELGILTGYPDERFDGTRAATRYEVAVVASRLLDTLGSTPATGALDTDLSEQIEALETALEGAASFAYTRRLEARIVALEASLNTQTESDTFPAEMENEAEATSLPPTADSATPLTPTTAQSDGNGLGLSLELSRRPRYPFYVGVSPGVVSTAGDVYLSLQTGFDGLVGPVGPAFRLTFSGGERELRFSLDALAKADLLVEELKLYAGFGLGATLRPDGESVLLEAPFGGEFFITDRASLFLQLTTTYGFAPISDVGSELSTGINLRF